MDRPSLFDCTQIERSLRENPKAKIWAEVLVGRKIERIEWVGELERMSFLVLDSGDRIGFMTDSVVFLEAWSHE